MSSIFHIISWIWMSLSLSTSKEMFGIQYTAIQSAIGNTFSDVCQPKSGNSSRVSGISFEKKTLKLFCTRKIMYKYLCSMYAESFFNISFSLVYTKITYICSLIQLFFAVLGPIFLFLGAYKLMYLFHIYNTSTYIHGFSFTFWNF